MNDIKCLSNYVKADMHCHSKPISLCSNVYPEEIVDFYTNKGYGIIVLTNHYRPGHIDQFGATKERMIESFLNDYRRAVEAAKGSSLKVILGAEVKVVSDIITKNEFGQEGPVNAEFLLYGVTERFLWETFNLYNLTQKELFEVCNEYNVLMYQSHPLRLHHFCTPLDLRYMHGVEVFNPHLYSDVENTLAIAKKTNLLMCGGSDLHYFDTKEAGMYLPKDISNATDLASYLRKGENIIFSEEGVIVYNGKQQFKIDY